MDIIEKTQILHFSTENFSIRQNSPFFDKENVVNCCAKGGDFRAKTEEKFAAVGV